MTEAMIIGDRRSAEGLMVVHFRDSVPRAIVRRQGVILPRLDKGPLACPQKAQERDFLHSDADDNAVNRRPVVMTKKAAGKSDVVG